MMTIRRKNMSYNILNIDDDPDILLSTKLTLKRKYDIFTASSLAEGLQEIKQNDIDLVLLDVNIGKNENGIEGLKQIKQLSPDTDVIMVTGHKEPKSIVQAVRSGAADYICKPLTKEELLAIVEKHKSIKDIKDRHNALIEELNPVDTRSRIMGSSPAFRALLDKANRLKGHTANILIHGESGTGKELLARHVHSLEKNSRRPFIAVNCAAIPEGLIESELFGHERGAFTGAHHRKIGKFELSNGGDIFLDEISSLKQSLQAKILRVLQEKEIVRVGGNSHVPVDFRVISATNDNLADKVEIGEFRVDLYHRLKVVELNIPPLRDRIEDIPLLIAYFLDKFARGGKPKKITPEAIKRLQEYSWPGNVREIENVMHSLSILCPGEVITSRHLPQWAKEQDLESTDANAIAYDPDEIVKLPDNLSSVTIREFIRRAERIYIKRALDINNGDKTKTAELLNMGRTTLYGKLKELQMFD